MYTSLAHPTPVLQECAPDKESDGQKVERSCRQVRSVVGSAYHVLVWPTVWYSPLTFCFLPLDFLPSKPAFARTDARELPQAAGQIDIQTGAEKECIGSASRDRAMPASRQRMLGNDGRPGCLTFDKTLGNRKWMHVNVETWRSSWPPSRIFDPWFGNKERDWSDTKRSLWLV